MSKKGPEPNGPDPWEMARNIFRRSQQFISPIFLKLWEKRHHLALAQTLKTCSSYFSIRTFSLLWFVIEMCVADNHNDGPDDKVPVFLKCSLGLKPAAWLPKCQEPTEPKKNDNRKDWRVFANLPLSLFRCRVLNLAASAWLPAVAIFSTWRKRTEILLAKPCSPWVLLHSFKS